MERHAAAPAGVAQVAEVSHGKALLPRGAADSGRRLALARGGERLVDGVVDGGRGAIAGAQKGDQLALCVDNGHGRGLVLQLQRGLDGGHNGLGVLVGQLITLVHAGSLAENTQTGPVHIYYLPDGANRHEDTTR